VDNIAEFRKGAKHAQPSLLLRNTGDRFLNVSKQMGPAFARETVSRALAKGDIDNDGDLDLLITSNGGPVQLLLNDGGNRNNAILIRAIGSTSLTTSGPKSNRDAIGARLKLTAGGRTFVDQVTSGSSYLAQNDMRVHVGLGTATKVDRLEITWPDGRVELVENLPVNHAVTVAEGKGEVGRVPFAR
jgi:hypothetical protein